LRGAHKAELLTAGGRCDPPQGHRNTLAAAVAGASTAIAIGVTEVSSLESHTPLAIIPFATSIVLATGSPQVEPPQPRALVGGNVVATLVGLLVLHATGPQSVAAPACKPLLAGSC
jgi:CBS-domain-containing membrane protein